MKKVLDFFNQWIFLMLLWLAFTMSFQKQELFTGLAITFVFALGSIKIIPWGNFILFNPKRLFYYIIYIPVFIWAMIKANLDVAYRVLHIKIPINSGIIKLKTNLKSDIGKLLLTNSITLTPGTIVAKVDKDTVFIHWIDVKTDNKEEQKKIIFENFEKILNKVTE